MEQFFALEDSCMLVYLGEYDCWDDLEYDVNTDKYVFVWTRNSFYDFISYGFKLLEEIENV